MTTPRNFAKFNLAFFHQNSYKVSTSNGNSNQKQLQAMDCRQTELCPYLHMLTAAVLKGDRNVGEQFTLLAWLIDPYQTHSVGIQGERDGRG